MPDVYELADKNIQFALERITYKNENPYFQDLVTFETKYSRMDQVKFFKGCLPQILLGPFLNTLSHLFLNHLFFGFWLELNNIDPLFNEANKGFLVFSGGVKCVHWLEIG